jgi:hypothetical protein
MNIDGDNFNQPFEDSLLQDPVNKWVSHG